VLITAGICMYILESGTRAAGEKAVNALGSPDIIVENTGKYIYFDGIGTETALVLFQGGKVSAEAYAPLCAELARNGTDCFVIKCPFTFSLFNQHRAKEIIEEYSYEHWYVGGHSLGGVAAGQAASEYSGVFDGIMLMASFSTKALPSEGLKALCIYGSEDGVLNLRSFEKNKTKLPENTTFVCIEGGNHSQFGDYGIQPKDNEPLITPEEQIEKTVEAWKTFIE